MQTQQDIAPHLETLTRALGEKVGTEVTEDDLRDEFAKYLEYGVPVDQAIKTILRHYGAAGTPAANAAPATNSSERVPLADVPANVPFVNLLVRLLSVNYRTVNARGEEKQIVWGMLGDETGTRPYTSWRAMEGLEKGDVVAIQGAYTKEYQGEAQINFGDRAQLEKREQAELPRQPAEFQTAPIGDLKQGMRGFAVTGRILNVGNKEIMVKGAPKTIFEGTIADETGKVDFTAWSDPGLKEGDAVTIEGGYVRAFRGIPQLNFDQDANITKAEGVASAETLDESATLTLGELVSKGGASDVAVTATLLEVRPGSGLVYRCPESGCSRVLMAGQCRLHGKGEGVADLRIKGILDDGTGAMNVIIGRPLTEQLLGKSLDECIEQARAALRPEAIHEELAEKLTGRNLQVRGNVLSDDYGLMMIARKVDAPSGDLEQAARELLAEMEAQA